MMKIGERVSSAGIHRVFYNDSDGQLVVKTIHDHDAYDPVFDANEEHKADLGFAPNFRKVASIPQDVVDLWLNELGMDEHYLDDEARLAMINFKLDDPDNAKFRTVPNSYRIKHNA